MACNEFADQILLSKLFMLLTVVFWSLRNYGWKVHLVWFCNLSNKECS